MANIRNHIKGDKIKWIITLIVGLLLIATVVILAVQLNAQVKTKTLGDSAYAVGSIGDDGKVNSEDEGALYTKDYLTVDGLKCDIVNDAKVTYQVFFYDADKEFIEPSAELTADFDVTSIPEGAEYCRIMITPTEDEDGKIGFFEKGGYVDQVEVTVYKNAK